MIKWIIVLVMIVLTVTIFGVFAEVEKVRVMIPFSVLAEDGSIEWLGSVVIAEEYYNSIGGVFSNIIIEDNYEIGLRSDGIVVWRKIEKKQEEKSSTANPRQPEPE